MSGIRGKNTKPEVAVRTYLHSAGLRFRLHVSSLPGKPDLVLPRWKAAVFVHGCFWHQHKGCRFAYTPKANAEFWRKKLGGNVVRDRRHAGSLKKQGWRVFTVWECDLSEARLKRLVSAIRSVETR